MRTMAMPAESACLYLICCGLPASEHTFGIIHFTAPVIDLFQNVSHVAQTLQPLGNAFRRAITTHEQPDFDVM